MVAVELWRPAGYLHGETGPAVKIRTGRTAAGHYYKVLETSDALTHWLVNFAPSLRYMHELQNGSSMYPREPYGMLFEFEDRSDAVLFKLTWGG